MDESKLWEILVKTTDGNYKVYNARRKKDVIREVCETIGIIELSEDQELKSLGDLNVIDLIRWVKF